jgi:muconolactone delta-isomerase
VIFDIFIKPLPKEAADMYANMVPKLQNAEAQINMSQSVPASGEMVGLWRKLRTTQSPPAENCAEYQRLQLSGAMG